MASAEQVLKVLPEDHRHVTVEDLADGSTVVRDTSVMTNAAADARSFPVSETLYQCADILADSGFVIVLVRDKDGVYLNAH